MKIFDSIFIIEREVLKFFSFDCNFLVGEYSTELKLSQDSKLFKDYQN